MPTRWFTASAWNKSRRSSVATLHRPARPERGMPAETAGSLHTGPPLQWLPPHRIGTSGVVQILAQHDQMRSVAEQGGPTGESPQGPASGGELVRDQGGEACPAAALLGSGIVVSSIAYTDQSGSCSPSQSCSTAVTRSYSSTVSAKAARFGPGISVRSNLDL